MNTGKRAAQRAVRAKIDARIADLLRDNPRMTVAEVADRVGRCPSLVSKSMKRLGKTKAQHNAAQREARWDQMQHLYVNTKTTIPEIAKQFNVTQREVSRMAADRGLRRCVWTKKPKRRRATYRAPYHQTA